MPAIKQEHHFLYLVYAIFFFSGMAQCFESVFPNEFIEYFKLTNTEWAYTSIAKNAPFLLFSIPFGFLASRIGYPRSLSLALGFYTAGTFLIVPALIIHSYGLLLSAFFCVGIGFNFQMVVGNPLLIKLGSHEKSSSRLNFGNALGAIAFIIAPLIAILLVPSEIESAGEKIPYLTRLFLMIGSVLFIILVFSLLVRGTALPKDQPSGGYEKDEPSGKSWLNARVILGFLAILLILGTEGGIFTFFQVLLREIDTYLPLTQKEWIVHHFGISTSDYQLFFTFFFASYAIGRLAAGTLQQRVNPRLTLLIALPVSIILVACIVIGTNGLISIILLILLGFFISMMFPTLYGLTVKGLGKNTSKASGLLTMGFLGSTIIPLVQGHLADVYNVRISFSIALITYLAVGLYLLFSNKQEPSIK